MVVLEGGLFLMSEGTIMAEISKNETGIDVTQSKIKSPFTGPSHVLDFYWRSPIFGDV